ncbi:MAG TPA: hypothetical protein VGL27_07830 [Negativicutes bacterium]
MIKFRDTEYHCPMELTLDLKTRDGGTVGGYFFLSPFICFSI